MGKKVWHIFRSLLGMLVLVLALMLTAMLLRKVLLSTGVPEKYAVKSKDAAMMDRYDMRMNNDISSALDGVLQIEKFYWLNDDDLVAPKPNPDNYGVADDPASLQWLLDEAGALLGIEEFAFNTDIRIYEGSSITYYL